MDKAKLLSHLAKIDHALTHSATLYIYRSAACILLDEPDRTSLDVDVAAPYSRADFADLQRAAETAGLPINPDAAYGADHLEWISALRLCLPKPVAETEITLWQGARLTIKTVPIPQLIASKLIRYDKLDQSDIQFLWMQQRVPFSDIESAVNLLPPPFNRNPVVLDNLKNLRTDAEMWGLL